MVRFKNRYLLCELVFPDTKKESPNIDSKTVYFAVRDAVLDAHGDYGLGAVQFSLSVKYFNIKTNIVIIRVERMYFDIVASSVIFVRKIGIHNVIIKTLHVGGSVRACQKFLITYHKKNLHLLYFNCKTEEQRSKVMQSIVEACDELENQHFNSKPALPNTTTSALANLLGGE
uniref:Ribonuclease P/MRP protein subunit POP5 n=1 Tax=Arion vulgaris TaxID=1028688 RepID=A0A0B7B3Z7_9EUPU